MEYVAGGELFDHLVHKGKLSPEEARAYFRQIIFGVDYCHRFNICHRDLKPENLLLDASKRTVKVADFGMAALQPSERMLETSCGSPHYASPEIVSGKSYKGTASDIWSCGIILFALLCGKLPFDDPNISKLLQKVKAGKFTMPEELKDSQAKDLIWRMLNVDPERRISMYEIMNHPWFTDNGIESNHNPVSNSYDKLSQRGYFADDESIDEDILKNLKTLWPDLTENAIENKLRSPEPNWQKTFYQLLINHQENHSGDADEEASQQEEEFVDRKVGGLGLDLGLAGNDHHKTPQPKLERRGSSSKKETPRPRRSLDTSRGSSPNPPRRELQDQNKPPSSSSHHQQQSQTSSRTQPQNASQTAQYAHLVAHRAAPTSPARQHQQQQLQQAAASSATPTSSTVNRSRQNSTSTPTRPRSNTATQATPPSTSRVPVPNSPYAAGRASVDTARPTMAQLNAAAGGVSRPVSPLPPPSPNTQATRGSSPAGPRRPSVSEGSTSSPAGSRINGGRQSMDQSRPMINSTGGSSPSRPLPTPNQNSNGSHTFSSSGTVASRVQAITYAQEVPRSSPVSRRDHDVIPLVRRATSPSQKSQANGNGTGISTVGITPVTAVQTRARSNSRSSTTSGTANGRSHGPINTNSSSSSVPRPSSRSSSRPPSPSKGTRPTSIFGAENSSSGGPPSIQSPNLGNESDPLFKDITDQLAFMHQSGDKDGLESQFDKLRSSIGGPRNPSSAVGSASVSTNRRSVYGEQAQAVNVASGDAQFEDAEEEEELDGEHSGMDLDSMSLSSNNSSSRQSPYTPTSALPPHLPNLGLALGIGMNFSNNPTKPLALPDNKISMVSRGGNGSTGMVRRHTDEVPVEKDRGGVSTRSSSRSNAPTSSARNSVVGGGNGPINNGRPLSLFSTSSRQSSNSNSNSTAAPTLGRKRSLLGGSSRRTTSENDNPMTTTSIRYEQTQEGVKPITGRISRPSSPIKTGSEFKSSTNSPIVDHVREKANAKPTRLQMKNPGLGLEINSNQNHSIIGSGPASAPINQTSNFSSSPRSPNFSQGLQTPSTIHSQLASPALSITSSSASSNPPPSPQPVTKSFFGTLTSGFFKWSPASSLLYSTENLSITSDETRRIMRSLGFSVDNGSFGIIKCETTNNSNSPKLKIRVNLNSLAVSNNHSNQSSPIFGGGQSPALSSISNSSGAGRSTNNSAGNRGNLKNYSTSVTFTLEGSGKKSHFEQIAAQVRAVWSLDASPTVQHNQNEVVGLGVH